MRSLAALALTAALAGSQDVNPELLYKRGLKLERDGKVVEAYLLYAQAAAADPQNRKYWARSQALRTRAAVAGKVMPAAVERGSLEQPADDAPPAPAPTREELDEAKQPQPPVELQGGTELRSFDVRADSQALFEQVAKAYGLDVVFDGDYQPGPPVRFALENVGYREALYALQTATGSFIVPIGPKLFMVVKDTPQKRTEQELAVAITIPIPDPVSVQEAQELGRGVQQLMELPKFAIDSAQRLVFIRGPVSKVEPARALFTQLLQHRPQVYLEVDVLTVSRNASRTLGLDPQTSFALATEAARSLTSLGAPFSYLRLGIKGAQLFAEATRSESRTLLHSELRALDAQPVTWHVGDQYPIVTMVMSPIASGSQGGYQPPPLFNFEDLGLSLKLTPKVHSTDELTLDFEAEFKALAGGGLNGIPIISNRRFAERVRLKFGEYAIVAGLVTSLEARTISGFAGLTDIPILSPLVSRTTKRKEDTEALLVIRPHLISSPPAAEVAKTIWTGTESRPRIPL